jgi:isocitrate/isopropylmalate dehydrogenase
MIPCTLIRGGGIGPEIVEAVFTVLDAMKAQFQWRDLGGQLWPTDFATAVIDYL